MRIPISIKIIISFLLISISSIFIVGKFSYNKTKNALIDRTFQQLISIRVEKEKRVQDFFINCENDLNNISKHEDARKIITILSDTINNKISPNEVFSNYLLGYFQATNKYKKCIFIDSAKNVFIYDFIQNKSQNKNQIKYSIFKEFTTKIEGNLTLKKEITVDNTHSIIIGKKLFEGQNYIGTLILEICYEAIDDIMFESNIYNGLGESGEVYLVGSDFLMRSSSRFISNSKFETIVKTEAVLNSFADKPGIDKILDYRGISVLSSYEKLDIENIDWAILAEIDTDEAMKPIKNAENTIIYLSIIISLLVLGFFAAISSGITSPIRKLQAETEKIYQGKYGAVINLKYNNEIGDLIRAFNKMSVKLQEQTERIEYEKLIRTTVAIDSQEAERQRLSRELHDGLAQYILAIKMKLEHTLSEKGETRQQLIEETNKLFSDTIKEIRNISSNLMPSVLTEYGLVKAVENLSKSTNSDTKLNFVFETNIKDYDFNRKTGIYLYRIIQETLNNTLKHSKATVFSVKMNIFDNHLELKIEDNGIGCKVCSQNLIKGNGLANIKERVNLLSGKISFETKMPGGFCVYVKIPT